MNKFWPKFFTRTDFRYILEIADNCLLSNDLNSFKSNLNLLKNLISFDSAACICLKPSTLPGSLKKKLRVLNYLKPQEFTTHQLRDRYFKIEVSLQIFLESLELQNNFAFLKRHTAGGLTFVLPDPWTDSHTIGLIYGTYEKRCKRWILYVFATQGVIVETRARTMIELTLPHLTMAFKRLRSICTTWKPHLTTREYEVLKWLKAGKSSWEIARILGISERGINFHVENIKSKLDCTNRTQAIAIAIKKNLVPI